MRNRYRPRQNRQRHHPDLGSAAPDCRRPGPDPDPSPDLAELLAAPALAPVQGKKIG